jgi:aryl-alcohol dehydrogenase-like predicted oxidoreductase
VILRLVHPEDRDRFNEQIEKSRREKADFVQDYRIDARTKFNPQMDVRSEFPRFSPANIAANMPIVDFLKQFSEKKKNATSAQISLAWLLAQKPFIVPIPGTRSAGHLRENLRAIDVQLTPADLREIETALSKIEVHGGRMNEERMKVVDQTA